MKPFEPRYETMPRPELEQLQLERLQALLARLRRNVRRYREKLGDLRAPDLAALARLPFTTPEELADSFPYGMFAFPLREVIRLHTTVGPSGRPVVIGHTRGDLQQWGRLVARQLAACGVTANDVVQLSLGSGLFPHASGYVLGAELLGASVIAEDPAHADYQVAMLQNYRPTVLITTPTHALDLIQRLDRNHTDAQSLHLRAVLLSRPVPPPLREQIAAGLFAVAHCNFGLGEVLDPGLCVECEAGHFHVHEDQFLVEVCDGELVITTLCREALPLLRYRTRVAARLRQDRCPCGRTGVILEPGERLDGRLSVNEEPLYENQIAEVLNHTRLAGHPFSLEITAGRVIVKVALTPDLFADTIWFLQKLQYEVEAEFTARLGIPTEVRFTHPPRPGP